MNKWLALLIICLIPSSAAQLTWGEPTVHDSADDIRMTNPAGEFDGLPMDHIDLVAAWIEEDPTHIHLKLQVKEMGGMLTTAGTTGIQFTIGSFRYTATMYRAFDTEQGFFGSLSRVNVNSNQYEYVAPLRVYGSLDDSVLWSSVDRDLLRTPSNLMHAGTVVKDITAISRWQNMYIGDTTWEIGDTAPDDGAGPSLTLEWNRNLANGLRMSTPEPFRASNGEETTYQYKVMVRNPGELAVVAPIFIENVPPAWHVSIPGSQLRLEPQQSTTFLVTASAPFAHQHGAAEAFDLVIGNADPPLAALQMGVHYIPVPQPAGHHSTLTIHTHPWSTQATIINPPLGGADGYATFNALDTDPGDTGIPISAYAWIADSTHYGWNLCWDPGLVMGLQWDQAEFGSTNIPINIRAPIQSASATGEFLIVPAGEVNSWCGYYGSDGEVVARFQSELGDLGPMSTKTIVADIAATTDRVEYAADQQSILQLRILGPNPAPAANGSPQLLSGGSFTLPLQEYHDFVATANPLDAAPASVDAALTEPGAESKGSPMGLPLGLAALAVLALSRRN